MCPLLRSIKIKWFNEIINHPSWLTTRRNNENREYKNRRPGAFIMSKRQRRLWRQQRWIERNRRFLLYYLTRLTIFCTSREGEREPPTWLSNCETNPDKLGKSKNIQINWRANTYIWRLECDVDCGYIFAGRQLPNVQIMHADYCFEAPEQIRPEEIDVNWAGYCLE